MAGRPRPVEDLPHSKWAKHIGPLSQPSIPRSDIQVIKSEPVGKMDLSDGDYVLHDTWPYRSAHKSLGVVMEHPVQRGPPDRAIHSQHFEDSSGQRFVKTSGVIQFSPVGVQRVRLRVGDRAISNFHDLTEAELRQFQEK